jgi:hypothetical protein
LGQVRIFYEVVVKWLAKTNCKIVHGIDDIGMAASNEKA